MHKVSDDEEGETLLYHNAIARVALLLNACHRSLDVVDVVH